jgi:hypothetical protein
MGLSKVHFKLNLHIFPYLGTEVMTSSIFFLRNIYILAYLKSANKKKLKSTVWNKRNKMIYIYRVSINDCRVQPAMETCQILNVPLCWANNECHIFRLGCWLLTRDKFQLCFTLANINVFII